MFSEKSYYNPDDRIIISIYPALLVNLAESFGADRGKLLRDSGVGDATIQSYAASISLQEFTSLISNSIALTSNSGLGIDYGKLLGASTMVKVLPLMLACENFEEAVTLSLGYCLNLNIRVEKNEQHFMLVIEDQWREDEAVQRFLIEAVACYILNLVPLLFREKVTFSFMALGYEEPDHADRYHAVFGENITFGQKENIFAFDRQKTSQPLLGANEAAKKALIERFDQEYQQYIRSESLPGRVADIIVNWEEGSPSAGQVAELLEMPLSSMSKKLQDSGSSFQKILDDIRCYKALKYLKQENLTVSEVAEILGYSDSSNFRKAFKSWTGTTPSSIRQKV